MLKHYLFFFERKFLHIFGLMLFFIIISTLEMIGVGTIPILLSDSIKNNKIKRKKPILLMGFGVGYSLSGGIIKFE